MGSKPQLHISGINMLARCGEQFRRRYIEGERIAPGISLIVGIATDRTVTKNLQSKIDTDKLLPLEQIKDNAVDNVKANFQKEFKLTGDEVSAGIKKTKEKTVDTVVKLSTLHAIEAAPKIEPISVQRSWVVELEGYPFNLAGTTDVEEESSIRDTKTTGRSPAKGTIEKSDQLTMYALGKKVIDGRLPKSVHLDYLVNTKVPKYVHLVDKRGMKDFQYILARIEAVATAIEKQVFMPVNSDHWICGPKWCGYWATCKYARNHKQF